MSRELTPRVPVSYRPHESHMTEDRILVSMGTYDGVTPDSHYGSNPAVDGTFAVVSALGQAKPMRQAAADTLDVSSSSTSDGPGQIGALTIRIEGLDGDFNEIAETVTLNGTTDVTTTLLFLHVNQFFVTTTGSNDTNVGDIYVRDDGTSATAGVPDSIETTFSKIRAGYSRSQDLIFTIPAGFSCWIMAASVFGVSAGPTDAVTFRGRFYIPGNDSDLVAFEGVLADFQAEISRGAPAKIPEKTTVWADAKVAQNTTEVSAFIDCWRFSNEKYNL